MSARDDLAVSFPWPARPGERQPPRWTGAGFETGSGDLHVLSYFVAPSGWSDDLTEMLESDAGGDQPIDLASRARVVKELQRHELDDGAKTIIEFGCSSGYTLRELRRAFPDALVIASDYVLGPLQALSRKQPEVPLLQIDLVRCPLPDASVDGVVALNVLEHIADDTGAVAQIHRILKPGGVACIELPAHPSLFDVHDRVLMHERRYTLDGAVRLFEDAGFTVERPTHLGFLMFPAFAAIKLRGKRLLSKSDAEQRAIVREREQGTKSSALMRAAMRAETALAGVIPRFPFGVRCVLTAVKR